MDLQDVFMFLDFFDRARQPLTMRTQIYDILYRFRTVYADVHLTQAFVFSQDSPMCVALVGCFDNICESCVGDVRIREDPRFLRARAMAGLPCKKRLNFNGKNEIADACILYESIRAEYRKAPHAWLYEILALMVAHACRPTCNVFARAMQEYAIALHNCIEIDDEKDFRSTAFTWGKYTRQHAETCEFLASVCAYEATWLSINDAWLLYEHVAHDAVFDATWKRSNMSIAQCAIFSQWRMVQRAARKWIRLPAPLDLLRCSPYGGTECVVISSAAGQKATILPDILDRTEDIVRHVAQTDENFARTLGLMHVDETEIGRALKFMPDYIWIRGYTPNTDEEVACFDIFRRDIVACSTPDFSVARVEEWPNFFPLRGITRLCYMCDAVSRTLYAHYELQVTTTTRIESVHRFLLD